MPSSGVALGKDSQDPQFALWCPFLSHLDKKDPRRHAIFLKPAKLSLPRGARTISRRPGWNILRRICTCGGMTKKRKSFSVLVVNHK